MAPELLTSPPSAVSFKTDVFAFTMTSMEIWTGQQPFVGLADTLVPGHILQGQRPARPTDVGDPLWSLWTNGWHDEPSQRIDMAKYLNILKAISYH
ncbi:hypothetical protein M422DRAFT_255527 [Sphaerobolus stellatus SS14]|nr:hypothetical protein M422DRAFT_255527 [Sphaerobolus stellatus SS14]